MTFTIKFRVRLLLIAVRSSLHENHIILLSKAPLIVYKARKTGVKNIEFISFTLLEGTYSIDDFNAKIKVGILQERLNI